MAHQAPSRRFPCGRNFYWTGAYLPEFPVSTVSATLGRLKVRLALITFFRLVDLSALAETNQPSGCLSTSPGGTAESSPGRTRISCWVGGKNEPHAAFRKESRTRKYV